MKGLCIHICEFSTLVNIVRKTAEDSGRWMPFDPERASDPKVIFKEKIFDTVFSRNGA